MADDQDNSQRTEDPTQKRLDDALKRGDVVKSQEVNTWFIMAGATLAISIFSGSMGNGILEPMRNLIALLFLPVMALAFVTDLVWRLCSRLSCRPATPSTATARPTPVPSGPG